jgi:AcrR family transcriptional regulator
VGTKKERPIDRRVLRTRRTLRDALITLILERGWEKVSVQDVCDRADVGRSTFYVHFVDKEDLLVGSLDDLRKALRAGQAGASSRPLGFTRGLIDHAHEQQRLFRAIIGKRSGLQVHKRFRELVTALVREDLSTLPIPRARMEATVHYLAGAFLELLIWWVDARNAMPPSELEELFHQLTTPVLAAAQGK